MARRRSSHQRCSNAYRRRTNFREPRQRFLIVCEGKKTEPNYFYGFRIPTVHVTVFGGAGSPKQIVRKAEQLQREEEYDQIWCVFDRDEWDPREFREAIDQAARVGVEVAYSNQAFELWYLLHFHYNDTALSRQDYMNKLNDLLGHPYNKNSETIFDELLPKQGEAIRNAERLLSQYQPRDPATNDPSTTVHRLVEQLIKYAGG